MRQCIYKDNPDGELVVACDKNYFRYTAEDVGQQAFIDGFVKQKKLNGELISMTYNTRKIVPDFTKAVEEKIAEIRKYSFAYGANSAEFAEKEDKNAQVN